MTLEDLYRLLRTGHVQAQGVMDTIEQPLVILDEHMCVVDGNPAFFRTFRVERDETIGNSLFRLGNGQWDIAELRRLLAEIVPRSVAVVGYEVSHAFETLGHRTFLVDARRMPHPDDRTSRILVTFDDVTERRREDEAKNVLISEGEHRLKNLLGVVRALAMRTRTQDRSATEYRDVFIGRLNALLKAQAFPDEGEDRPSVEALVRRQLQPFADQARIEPGPDVKLPGKQAAPLSLILHELTVNAAKYGALSVPAGIVHVAWRVEDEDGATTLALDWREENGPLVAPTTHGGFGNRLIEHSIRNELGGEATIDRAPEGLRASLRIAL